jgi:uncharacterized protein YecE (DUF72 family)
MQEAPKYYIGIGGWEHDLLNNCFYPDPGASSARKLAYYARWFSAVEVRATFWDDTLAADDAREWLEAVKDQKEFYFNVKLHMDLTHKRNLSALAASNQEDLIEKLHSNSRLGAVLAQFPYSFTNTGANRQFLEKLALKFSGYPLHVEIRHASWDYPGLYTLFSDLKIGPVNADMPRTRQFIPYLPRTVGDQAYMRLHGRNEKGWLLNTYDGRYDYLYNHREMQEIRRRIFAMPPTCSRVFVLWNNTTNGKAVANALQCKAMLRSNGAIPAPPATVRTFPWLKEIVRTPSGDAPLFGDEAYRPAI